MAEMQFSEEEKTALKELFDEFDTDSDGKITQKDLKAVCEKYGMKLTEEEAKKAVLDADTDKTGFIGFENFVDALILMEQKVRESRARRIFKTLDVDNTGTLSADNLRDILDQTGMGKDTSNDEIHKFIKECDKSGDGQVSFEEFMQMVNESLDAK